MQNKKIIKRAWVKSAFSIYMSGFSFKKKDQLPKNTTNLPKVNPKRKTVFSPFIS